MDINEKGGKCLENSSLEILVLSILPSECATVGKRLIQYLLFVIELDVSVSYVGGKGERETKSYMINMSF